MANRPTNIKHVRIKSFSASLAVLFAVGFGILVFSTHEANPPSHAAASCTLSAILVNPCRPWVGAAARGNPGTPSNPLTAAQKSDPMFQANYFNGLTGHKMDIFRNYASSGAIKSGTVSCSDSALPFSANSFETQLAKQTNPVVYPDVNWKPAGNWLNADGGGSAPTTAQKLVNQEIACAAENVKKMPHKVFLTIWHEPQNDVSTGAPSGCPMSGHAGSPKQYIAMWQNVRNIFNAHGVNNVVWVMNYMGSKGEQCLIPPMYPGDNLVDWIIYDNYDHDWSASASNFDNTDGQVYQELVKDSNSASNHVVNANGQPVDIGSKPWGIGEFGTCKNVNPTNSMQYYSGVPDSSGNVTPVSTSALYAFQHNLYPKLKMYLVYADNGNNSGYGCLTDHDADPSNPAADSGAYDPKKQIAFNALFDAILNTTSSSPTPTTTITAPTANATVKGTATVSATAAVSSGTITKLVLQAGSSVIKTCTNAASCSTAWNTKTVPNGTVSLSAIATASDNKTGSSSENVTVNNPPPPPSVPMNITSPAQTTTSIDLSWSASTDANYPSSQLVYHVFRNGTKVGTTKAGTTSFTDSGLAPGTYYSYTVNATDPAGRTSVQSTAFAQNTKTPDCPKPSAPTGLAGSAPTPTRVDLHWNAVSNPSGTCVILHYVVSRDSVPLSQTINTSITDNGVVATTTYTYSVVAVETGNIAGDSASVSVTTPKPTQQDPGPSAPTKVKGSAVSTTQINLSWAASTDSVTGIKQYNVMRNGKQVGSATTTSFGDSGLTANTVYQYQIVAVSGGNKTKASGSVSVKTLPATNPGGGNNGGSSQPPILQGTHSVGSGSDTGQSSSQNPTAGSGSGNGTGNGNTNTAAQNTPKKSATFKTAALIGGGILLLLLLAGIALLMRRRRFTSVYPDDPDLGSHIVINGHEQHPVMPDRTPPTLPDQPDDPNHKEPRP